MNIPGEKIHFSIKERIRRFIKAVEDAAAAKGQLENGLDELRRWASWAREHADRLDPLKGELPFQEDDTDFVDLDSEDGSR